VRAVGTRLVMVVAAFAIAFTGLVAVPPPAAQAAVIGDNYPKYLGDAAQDALVDPWRFYNRECTSFVAWRLNSTNGVPFTNQYLGADLWWGNANTWGTSARAKGILVDNIPAVGSVAWSTAGKYGHVAWVAEVLDNGRIVVEEYNWGVNSLGEKGRYRERTTLASSFTGFIHIKDLTTWPPSDGTFINVTETGEVYRIAGGAPMYVTDWAVFGGPQYAQNVSKAKFDTLPKVPRNATYIRGESSGDVYTIAHGAPIHVASWAGVGGEKPTIGVDDAVIDNAGKGGIWKFLRAIPSDGFIRGATSYRVYRIVAGRPYHVSSWDPYGGEQLHVNVDDASINACAGFNCDPWGALDTAKGGQGSVAISGWAQDPNVTTPVSVHFYIDGKVAGNVRTTVNRPDVEAVYPRGVTSGYSTTLATTPGAHDLCAYAINSGRGVHNTHLGCIQFTAAAGAAFGTQPTPTVGGTVRMNESLTAAPGTWAPAATVTYQWKADGTAIEGATGKTVSLTPQTVGKRITVTTTASRTGYATASKTSAATGPVAPLSVFASAPTPTLNGTTTAGSVLTASVGTWAPTVGLTLQYSWARNGSAIAGATGTSYTLTTADIGKSITFSARGTKVGYDPLTKTSAATAKIAGRALTSVGAPSVSGTPKLGQTLRAQPGVWAPTPVVLGYQWLRNGVAIPGATASSYTVGNTDPGTSLTVTVTGSKSGYSSAAKTSAAVAVPILSFTSAPQPTLRGQVMVGQSIVASANVWAPGPASIVYQWKRGSVDIKGATGTSYTPTAADMGHAISVVTTAVKPGYSTVVRQSAPTAAVRGMALTTTRPTLKGQVIVGQTIASTVKPWGPAPVAMTYQWLRDGVAIPGATGANYTLREADRGKAMSMSATGTKAGYGTITMTSAATVKIR
jgi:surface antigen